MSCAHGGSDVSCIGTGDKDSCESPDWDGGVTLGSSVRARWTLNSGSSFQT